MASYNHIELIGRITHDPELKQTPNGKAVSTIKIAVQRNYKTNGEYISDFFNVVLWGQNAEYATKYIKQGALILVAGRMETRSYTDPNGVKRTHYDVVADTIQLLVPKKSASSDSSTLTYGQSGSGGFEELGDGEELPF